jgi:hypothetical protein
MLEFLHAVNTPQYINDLPKIISELSKPILFADDTSIIISDKDPTNLKIKINKVFDITNEWFATNLLTINYEKTYFLQFQTKNSKMLDIQVSYRNNQIWGNSSYSVKVFRIQKRIITVMTNSARTPSCRSLVRKLGILPLQAAYFINFYVYYRK